MAWTAELISPYTDLDALTQGVSLLFQTVVISLFVAIGAFLRGLKRRVQQKQEYAEYRSRALEAELSLLKQQLNEHFLFNTLNSIYLNILEQKDVAAEMVIKLSEMLRYSLIYNAKEFVSLEEELTFIRHYLYFEQRRLPAHVRLDFQLQVDDPEATLSPNLLMPLIENSIKHGSNTRESTTIKVRITADASALELITENAVYAIAKNKSSYTGQRNLHTRLQYLYPGKHTLTHQQEENLYRAHLKISLT